MSIKLKNLLFTFTFNFTLFIVLILGIQNSSYKRKVNLLINETVNLPISFIVGISFISGSILGSLISVKLIGQEE